MHILRIVVRLLIWTYFFIVLFVALNNVVAAHFYKKVVNETYENIVIWSFILSVVLLPIALFLTMRFKADPSNLAIDDRSPFRSDRLTKCIGYAACLLELAIFLHIALLNTRVIER